MLQFFRHYFVIVSYHDKKFNRDETTDDALSKNVKIYFCSEFLKISHKHKLLLINWLVVVIHFPSYLPKMSVTHTYTEKNNRNAIFFSNLARKLFIYFLLHRKKNKIFSVHFSLLASIQKFVQFVDVINFVGNDDKDLSIWLGRDRKFFVSISSPYIY